METKQVLASLRQLTGNLKPANAAEHGQLEALERTLTELLLSHPELSVTGNPMLDITPVTPESHQPSTGISAAHIADLLHKPVAQTTGAAPLVFRRETAFRNNLFGGSVPEWGVGLAPTVSFGPISTEQGIPIWFDFFFPTRLVRVGFLSSGTELAIPIFGMLTPRTSYKIEPGSVWIASGLIAADPGLGGFYTGLKVTGGTLQLSRSPSINNGQIELAPGSTAKLHIDLAPAPVTAPSPDAGFDATDAVVDTPDTLSLNFNEFGGTLQAGDASCTVFGCKTDFHFANQPAAWLPQFSQILIPYGAKTDSPGGDVFTVRSSRSLLCSFTGEAKLGAVHGWLLPAAKVDSNNFGQAAGKGALTILLNLGLEGAWKGLAGAKTRLVHPAIVAEPGMVTVIDFFAANTYGRQKLQLWRNAGSEHHSEIALAFGKSFPLIFVSSSAGHETVTFLCNLTASLDRPVDANAHPFKIESPAALVSIVQTQTKFRVLLFDFDLVHQGKGIDFEASTVVLVNAFLRVAWPYSLLLFGELHDDVLVGEGTLALSFALITYIPTLPDPYVTSFASYNRSGITGAGRLNNALVGIVGWPDPLQVTPNTAADDNPAVLDFRLLPLSLSQLAPAATTLAGSQPVNANASPALSAITPISRNFRTGLRTFSQPLTVSDRPHPFALPTAATSFSIVGPGIQTALSDVQARMANAIAAAEIQPLVREMETNPLLAHIPDKTALINSVLNSSAVRLEAFQGEATQTAVAASRASFFRDLFMLLDISSNADQMGVSLGTAIRVEQTEAGAATLRSVPAFDVASSQSASSFLQIDKLSVTMPGAFVRAVTLPQVSWEPFWNIPLAIEGSPDPQDLITVTPGIVLCDRDGPPTRIASATTTPIAIAPLPATSLFLKEYNDQAAPQALYSSFSLPFSMTAQATFQPSPHSLPGDTTSVTLHQPFFDQLQGGVQIKVRTLTPKDPGQSASLPGWTVQLDNLKWFLFGLPISGSTLGNTVRTIFNGEFQSDNPSVPLEGMEICGYGASIFSNWRNDQAKIAEVSQALFNVMVGRTAHEVVQVRSILYPFGVHVVRTITLLRSPNGYVFRSDSGWKAESDGFFDFSYTINFHDPLTDTNPFPDQPIGNYTFHHGTVRGISNVREIRDFPDAGAFKSSFTPNDSGLPLDKPRWQFLFNNIINMTDPLAVDLEPVVFDADVHLDNVISGGAATPNGDFIVQSRKMLGYVQLAPAHVLIPPKLFANLLNFQNGSLGGPVDCIIDVNKSRQHMRLSRVDVSPARDAAGNYLFVTAERGSFILPKDGSWSVVKQHTETGDVQPLDQASSVPLIQTNGDTTVRAANPADVVQSASNIAFGVMQSTGTQKLLFSVPQFLPGVPKLKSADTFFADAYKLLNAKGPFPNIANALGLESPQKELDILGEGLLKLAAPNIDLHNLLPANYQYVFIDEPGVLKVYVEYGTNVGENGSLGLDINSGASSWKAALSNIRVVVDLGPFPRLMWVDGNFDAASGLDSKYNKPNLQFSGLLKTAKDILLVLEKLSGGDFDNGMKVGMSNSPDNWEYKFDCSQEIPVIQFPSPEELALDPNPPLKLAAGLQVGFYFNEVISIPTDLSQLVPAAGAYVNFFGRVEVQCFTLAIASVYGVGQVNLGIAADTKAGKLLKMRFGFGAEIVVGLPVILNVSVLYVVGVQIDLGETSLTVGASLMFRGSADICDGLISVCIQIEAAGSIQRAAGKTNCIAQVTFSLDVSVAWVIDISFSDSWQETRQIA
jgi:hypothetical protein